MFFRFILSCKSNGVVDRQVGCDDSKNISVLHFSFFRIIYLGVMNPSLELVININF